MTLNSFAKARNGNEKNLSALDQSKPVIPAWLIWIQCIAFVVLYAVWILPEIVGFRNTALVVGALAGVYPIYEYRKYFLQKSAISIWLIAALFIWVIFHLLFLSQDYAQQLLELMRIWKYAALAAIFALGLGLSLASTKSKQYGYLMYFGLMSPVLIYLTCPGIFRPNAFRDNDSFNLRSRYEESTVFRRTDCSDIARGRS